MNNELTTRETRTPIEIALEMNDDGMVSAKKLYEFLELAPSQFARWCKDNIVDNPLVDENTDYFLSRHNVELAASGGKVEYTDYLLTVEFAKELCMSSRTPKAKLARDYFKKTEKTLVVSIKQYNELANNVRLMMERQEQLGKLVQDTRQEQIEKLETISARLDIVEEKGEVVLDAPTIWAADMMKHVRKIANFYTRGDTNKCMDRLIERAEDYMCETYETLKADFAAHSNGKKAKKILIMARDEDTRDAFERAVKDYEIEFGLYEQNAGQKFLEEFTKDMFEEAYVREYTPIWNPSDEELAAQYADMEKMYGPGWDKGDDYGSKDSDE